MARTKEETIREATDFVLNSIDPKKIPAPGDIKADILERVADAIDVENSVRAKNRKWKAPDRLLPVQVAQIITRLYPIAAIETGGKNCDKDYTLLGLYQADGPNAGIYVESEETFENLADEYCYGMTEFESKEMFRHLRRMAPRRLLCKEPHLIAVNNGIFDYDKKQLLPFTPELVFMAKSRINYNPKAVNVIIHNPVDGTDWDVESWMESLSPDKGVVYLLWQILGAIIRPNVPWNTAAWFYSEKGNNGKGTFCELARQLCGEGTYASIPLSDMSKDFMLEPLTRATAIIVDENDVGTYIDKAANLKAIITGDTITINRKFKTALPFQFHGFMIQCLNEMPRIRDKSDSFYRRQIFIEFLNCFTGVERKYIKNDYLHRQDVLEYVLFKVLNMSYYEFDVPDVCKQALEEYKEFNDPVRQFMGEIMDELQWDLVPFQFLHDLYKAWYKKNFSDRGDMKSSVVFIKDVVKLLDKYPNWSCDDKRKSIRPGNKMDKTEPLIDEYNLVDWMNPQYMSSKDIDKKCRPALKSYYRGIVRV